MNPSFDRAGPRAKADAAGAEALSQVYQHGIHRIADLAESLTRLDRVEDGLIQLLAVATDLGQTRAGLFLLLGADGDLVHLAHRGLEPAHLEVWQTANPLHRPPVVATLQQQVPTDGPSGLRAYPQLFCFPVSYNQQALGVLCLLYRSQVKPGAAIVDLCRLLSQTAAYAIEAQRWQNATEIQKQQLIQQKQAAAALQRVNEVLGRTIDLDTILDHLLEQIATVVPYDTAGIMLLEGDEVRLSRLAGYEHFDAEVVAELYQLRFFVSRTPNLRRVVETQRPYFVANTHTDPGWIEFEPSPDIGSWIGAPIVVQGVVRAIITLDKREPDFYQPDHVQLALAFAAIAAMALERAELFIQVQGQADQLKLVVAERTHELLVLLELTQDLSHATQITTLIEKLLLHLGQIIDNDVAALLFLDDTEETLFYQAVTTVPPHVLDNLETIMARAVIDLTEVQGPNQSCHRVQLPLDPRIRPERPLPDLTRQDLASLIQVPLYAASSQLIGVLLVARSEVDYFSKDDVRFVLAAAEQAAIAIQRVQHRAAAEYQRFVDLVTHLPDGLILLDAQRQILLVNRVGQDVLRQWSSAQVGDVLNELGPITLDSVLHKNPNGLQFDMHFSSAALDRQTYEATLRPVLVGPEAGGWILLIRNVTRERDAQAVAQQQTRLAAVGQLAAGIAHDFNNILTSIIGLAGLAEQNPGLPPALQPDMGRIIEQSRRAANLVRQILDFSRHTETALHELDYVPFLKETVRMLERTIPEGIQIKLTLLLEQCYIQANPAQLQQMLTNLALNARDAMPRGGHLDLTLDRITVDAQGEHPAFLLPPGEWVSLSVRDTGVGIPEEIQSRIYDPFFTTKEVGKGTGLGLSQVYGIVRQHNGHIRVRSQVGQGTTFTIYLPLFVVDAYADADVPLSDQVPQGRGEVVLLVEDDVQVRQVTQGMLRHLGYQVLAAQHGQEGLETFERYRSKIAVIITDMMMPVMNGAALIEALTQRQAPLPIIALSGYPIEADEVNRFADQVVFVQKPVSVEDLGRLVYDAIAKS